MYDAGFPSDVSGLQRARGELRVRVTAREGRTVLDRLFQAGCLKARFPRGAVRGWFDVVTLNTSGGIAGGDRLNLTFEVMAGARATIAAQAAERYYRVPSGNAAAQMRACVSVGDGAAAEWLPQETILFDGVAMDRRLDVELSASSRFVGVETLVFGRAASGERVRNGRIRDVIRLRRAERLIWHDAVRMDGEIDALLRRSAIADSARAVATLVHVAPEAEQRVDATRAALERMPAESGVSGWDGMLIARLLAADAAPLRQAVAAALAVLRENRPLPRVWSC
jgi:urease accessory protein